VGSERILNKNTKTFAGIDGGLLALKLNQLIKCDLIDEIILSTDDKESLKKYINYNNKVIINNRPFELAASWTKTDDLNIYAETLIKEGHILWAQVTSPLVNENIYTNALLKYLDIIKEDEYDSLISITKYASYFWNIQGQAINYDRSQEKWPSTKLIEPFLLINNAFSISNKSNFIKYKDRIGIKPYLYELDKITSIDIDYQDEFELAETFYKLKNKNEKL
jgi:CMP-N-acetylneuraminic acid synthetase